MSWRDQLRPASFRGVPFFVESSRPTFGRNIALHEYPDQAPPFPEDLGRRARTYDVEGYVIGEDYRAGRDRLIEAVELEAGAGDLVHPYFGTVRVVARSISISETAREGRMARFAIEFVEAPIASAPAAVEDLGDVLEVATTTLFQATGDDFEQSWNPVDEPATLVEAGAAQASGFWSYLSNLQLRGPIEKVGEWRDRLTELADTTEARLRSPGGFASDVSSLLEDLLDAVGSRKAAIEAYLGLGKVKTAPSFGTSASSRKADQNRDAIGRLFREHAAALAARASGEATWSSYDDALAARGRALDALSAAQDVAGDATFRELAAVSRALTDALPLAPGTLPRITTYDVVESTSALVVAYRLFDDVTRADEIVERNAIANPLAILGGQTLEVLSRA